MRIQSKFKDYYDYGMSFGQDPLIFYDRTTKVIEGEEVRDLWTPQVDLVRNGKFIPSYPYDDERVRCSGVVGFCGVEYCFADFRAIMSATDNYDPRYKEDPKKWIKYNQEWRKLELSQKKVNDGYEWDLIPTTLTEEDYPWHLRFQTGSRVARNLNAHPTNSLFEKYQVPVYAIVTFKRYTIRLILNPCLADFNFMAIEPDGIQAFQKISQYISSLNAKNQMPPVNHDDETKRDSHGFDKFSFRKDKQK